MSGAWGDKRFLWGIVPPETERGLQRWLAEIDPGDNTEFHATLAQALAIAARATAVPHEDGLQEALYRLCGDVDVVRRWRTEGRSRSWMAEVLKNTIIDSAHRLGLIRWSSGKRVTAWLPWPDMDRQERRAPWDEERGEELPLMSGAEMDRRLAALESLKQVDKNLLLAYHVGGWSIQELAEMNSVTEVAIRRRLERSRSRVRDASPENTSAGVVDIAA